MAGLRWAQPQESRPMQFAALANKWQKFATYSEACLKPVDEQSNPKEGRSALKKSIGIARCADDTS